MAFAVLSVVTTYAYEAGDYVYGLKQKFKIVSGTNLITNGDFSDGKTGFCGVTVEATPDTEVWDLAEGEGPNGENAIKALKTGAPLCGQWEVESGKTYVVMYDVKGATTTGFSTSANDDGTVKGPYANFFLNTDGSLLPTATTENKVTTRHYTSVCSEGVGYKDEWQTIIFGFTVSDQTILNMRFENLAAETMITNIGLYEAEEVYDDRLAIRNLAFVDQLIATGKFTQDTPDGFVSNVVEGMRSMIGTADMDDASNAEALMAEYNKQFTTWLDMNTADMLLGQKRWSSYSDTRKQDSFAPWSGTGGRWFHKNNGGSNMLTADGDEIGHRFQGGMAAAAACQYYTFTPAQTGTLLFSIEVLGHYMVNTASAWGNYSTDWNRDFKGVTVYAGPDVLKTDAAAIEASQNTKVDCGVVNTPYGKQMLVIREVTAGEPVTVGVSYIPDPEVTGKYGSNVNIANPQIRITGISQIDYNYEKEVADIKAQQTELASRLVTAADYAAKTKADGFPWGHEALDSVRNASQNVLTDSYTFVDQDGGVLRENDIRDSLITEGAKKVSDYVLNEVNSIKRAWQSYESLNASYTSLIEKAAEAQAFLNANVGRGDAERRQALENLVTQANGMIEATGAEEEKEAFDKQTSDITEAIAVYKNTTTTYADPSEQQIAANPESSSDKNWTFTANDTGKENFKRATQGEGWEAGYYTAVWRGNSASPQSKMVQTKEITDAGVYAFKAHATATNENYAYHVLMADIIDADPETGVVADTIFNHSEVKLFFGEAGAADSVRVASRLRLNTGNQNSGAGSALASFGYDADPYVIYLIKADDKPMTVEFGMSTFGQIDKAGCNTYGFGDTQLLYYGKEDAFRQAMVADMTDRIAACEAKLTEYAEDATLSTWTSRLSRRLVDAKSALAQTTSAKDLTTLANATFFVEQIAAKLKAAGIKGDVNGDGKIDVEDVVGIVNKILGEPAENFLEAYADVTGDGKIDVDDVVAVVNIILEGSDAAAAPQLMNILLQNGFKF